MGSATGRGKRAAALSVGSVVAVGLVAGGLQLALGVVLKDLWYRHVLGVLGDPPMSYEHYAGARITA